MSIEIANGKAMGLDYAVHARTGTISGTQTRSETEVSGNISGGGSYGNGYNAPVQGNVTSKTTNHQDIFLTDDDGVEHLIQTVDFLIPCREGQRATFYFVNSGNAANGSYFSVYNHNSRESYDHNKALRKEMFPWLAFFITVAVFTLPGFLGGFSGPDGGFGLALFSGAIFAAVGAAVAGIAGSVVGALRASTVRRDARFANHRQRLASEPSAPRDAGAVAGTV